MKLRTVKRIKVIVDALIAANGIASVICFILLYGTVGTMDYHTEIGYTGDETGLFIQMFVLCGLWALTLFATYIFSRFSQFLSDCIELRIARIRRRRIELQINENREILKQSIR